MVLNASSSTRRVMTECNSRELYLTTCLNFTMADSAVFKSGAMTSNNQLLVPEFQFSVASRTGHVPDLIWFLTLDSISSDRLAQMAMTILSKLSRTYARSTLTFFTASASTSAVAPSAALFTDFSCVFASASVFFSSVLVALLIFVLSHIKLDDSLLTYQNGTY